MLIDSMPPILFTVYSNVVDPTPNGGRIERVALPAVVGGVDNVIVLVP